MTGSIVARRYARALFDLGRESGKKALESIGKDLAAFVGLVQESPELARLFKDPVFSPAEKRNVLAALAERLGTGANVRDFCFLLADKGRLDALEAINGEYQALLDAEQGIVRGTFASAIPLKDEKRKEILSQLEKKAGRTLALDFTVDETLLGGMVLQIGDKVMDASLKTQLSLLKDTIKRGD